MDQQQQSKRAQRAFTVMDVNPETGLVDRNAVMDAFHAIEANGHYLGGAWICSPLRAMVTVDEGGRQEYRCIGWAFEWTSYMPAVAPPAPTATPAGEQAAAAQAARDTEAAMAQARAIASEQAEPAAAS